LRGLREVRYIQTNQVTKWRSASLIAVRNCVLNTEHECSTLKLFVSLTLLETIRYIQLRIDHQPT